MIGRFVEGRYGVALEWEIDEDPVLAPSQRSTQWELTDFDLTEDD